MEGHVVEESRSGVYRNSDTVQSTFGEATTGNSKYKMINQCPPLFFVGSVDCVKLLGSAQHINRVHARALKRLSEHCQFNL